MSDGSQMNWMTPVWEIPMAEFSYKVNWPYSSEWTKVPIIILSN